MPSLFHGFKLIIYDNSLLCQRTFLDIPFEYQYVHNPKNVGLAKAYNYALCVATESTYKWILLFDQDTKFGQNFLLELTSSAHDMEKDNSIVAWLPKAFYNNTLFSPSKMLWGGVNRPIDIQHIGICDFPVTTVGSGVLLRTSFLQVIGGFNEIYWLDCLDRWLFHLIYSLGKRVYITEAIIEHDLSVLDYNKFMTEPRYQNILKYEALFMKSYNSRYENYFLLIRLLKRTLILLVKAKNKQYAKITFYHIIKLIRDML